MKNILLPSITLFILMSGVLSLPALGQNEKKIGLGKHGDFHLDSSLRVGDGILKSGMYRAEIVADGNSRFIVIREIQMNKFGRSMGSTKLGGEVARVKCAVEPTSVQNKDSKILVHKSAANKRQAVEVWFKNESVKYVLSPNSGLP